MAPVRQAKSQLQRAYAIRRKELGFAREYVITLQVVGGACSATRPATRVDCCSAHDCNDQHTSLVTAGRTLGTQLAIMPCPCLHAPKPAPPSGAR